MVDNRYVSAFGRREQAPFIMSELCALDMIYAVATMKAGYYGKALVLKGGLSVRNHVPLMDHRFSFDADYDPNFQAGYSFGKVDKIRKDLLRSRSGCVTRVAEVKDDERLYFLELGYKEPLREEGVRLVEAPKIELCKTCKVLQAPEKAPMNTFLDLRQLNLPHLEIFHVALEEQLATKLFIIGSSGRQRNQFDAYDAMRIVESKGNKLNWKQTRNLFEEKIGRAKSRTKDHIAECNRQLDSMLLNTNKMKNLEETTFKKFDFREMVTKVKSLYDFEPWNQVSPSPRGFTGVR